MEMAFLKEKARAQVEKIFQQLANPVKLLMFTQSFECEHCEVTREITEELAGLSDLLSAEVLDFVADKEEAERHGVDKIPAILLLGAKDYGLRYYGVPAGYEFATLIESIVDVSRGPAEMPAEIMAGLSRVDSPVKIEVLGTPT